MKTKLSIVTALSLLAINLNAQDNSQRSLYESLKSMPQKDKLISIYGINAKTNKDQSSHNGLGIYYNTDELKLKVEHTSDFLKTGGVMKFNPIDAKLYIKVGANYLNQRLYAPDNATKRVNQYSGALGIGYMMYNDLYFEAGGSISELNGGKIGTNYEIKDETTKQAYAEVAKRFESNVGTIDTTLSGGKIYKELSSNNSFYALGLDFYPTDYSKIGYFYSNTKNNISNKYSFNYGMFVAEYNDNISQKTRQVSLGIQLAFTDLTDFSSYSVPKNIKPHLSELHKFEEIVFYSNMNIQSSKGVEQAREAISNPTLQYANTPFEQSTSGTITPTTTNIRSGAVYTIVSSGGTNNLSINSSTGVITYSGNGTDGNNTFTVSVRVTNTDGGTNTTSFTLTTYSGG